jgi:Zn-finger nucleic acid-binding protein
MRCPSCPTSVLALGRLEEGLTAYACATCEGYWLASTEYQTWLHRRIEAHSPEAFDPNAIVVSDVQHAKLCPSCARIMLRYRVGHGAAVSLDVCGSCSGIWFDRNEWLVLKAHGLHDHLHQVATEPWQAEVRREETRAHLEALYRKRYGADYDEVVRVRRWLGAHPERQSILAFLTDPDPFLV